MKVLSKTGYLLLEVILAVGDAAKAVSEVPYKHSRIKSKTSYYRALKELSQSNLIKKRRVGRKNTYTLTEAGRKILKKPKYNLRRDDGLSTVIIFDVPEDKSRQRTIFRRYLLRNGYSPLQKSVFIGPYKLNPEIERLVRELGIFSHITTLDAKVTYFF